MTTGRINQNHSTASCPGATIEPHERVSMASQVACREPRSPTDSKWKSQSIGDCIKPQRTEALQTPVHACTGGSRNLPEMNSGGGDLGSMARGGAHPWPTAKAVPTHDRMPLHHLGCPAAGQIHEARRSGMDTTRTGLIHVGAGLIFIAEVAACLTL